MVNTVYRLLYKLNLLEIIPFEKTFFFSQLLPKSIKLSPALLNLNYSKFSPFKDTNIISLLDKKYLMLWFYETKSILPIVIPESYLYYKEFKNRTDAVYVLEDTVFKVIVIKNAKLLHTFVLKTYDETILNMSLDEYSLHDIVNIPKDEVQNIYTNNLHNITFKDCLSFSQINLDRKSILKQFVESMTYPLTFLILLHISISYFQGLYLQKQIKDLESTYTIEKHKKEKLTKNIKTHNKIVEKYMDFRDKELIGVEPIVLLKSIYTIFKDDEKASIEYYSLSNLNLILKIRTNLNPVSFLNRISNIKYIKNVMIQRTLKQKNRVNLVIYSIELKKRKDIK